MKHFLLMIFVWVVFPLTFWLTIAGCAGLLPVATTLNSHAVQASHILHTLDQVYSKWMQLKDDPALQAQATRVLALADETAKELRAIINGKKTDDAKLNALAGAVSLIAR